MEKVQGSAYTAKRGYHIILDQDGKRYQYTQRATKRLESEYGATGEELAQIVAGKVDHLREIDHGTYRTTKIVWYQSPEEIKAEEDEARDEEAKFQKMLLGQLEDYRDNRIEEITYEITDKGVIPSITLEENNRSYVYRFWFFGQAHLERLRLAVGSKITLRMPTVEEATPTIMRRTSMNDIDFLRGLWI